MAEWWLPGAGGGRNEEMLLKGNRVSDLQNQEVLEVDGGDAGTTM